MTFTQFRMFCYSGISTLLIIRIIFYLLDVNLNSTDGHDLIRLFLCASVSFILLSRVYLHLIIERKDLYYKVREPLTTIITVLAIIDIIFIIGFVIMKRPPNIDELSPLDWLKLLFWSSA